MKLYNSFSDNYYTISNKLSIDKSRTDDDILVVYPSKFTKEENILIEELLKSADKDNIIILKQMIWNRI